LNKANERRRGACENFPASSFTQERRRFLERIDERTAQIQRQFDKILPR